MYITHCLKVLILSFLFTFSSKQNFTFCKNTTNIPPNSFEGFIIRVKKGLNIFTDCSVDRLLEHCDKDTTKNFECFRCLGECISKGFRTALSKETAEKKPEEPNPNEEL